MTEAGAAGEAGEAGEAGPETRRPVSVMQRFPERPHCDTGDDISGGPGVSPPIPHIRPLITYQTCYGR